LDPKANSTEEGGDDQKNADPANGGNGGTTALEEAVAMRQGPPCSPVYMYILCFCLVYPVFYDGTQMVKQGMEYF